MYYFTIKKIKDAFSFFNSRYDTASGEYAEATCYNKSIEEQRYIDLAFSTGDFGFLPPGLRFFDPINRVALIELPPAYRTISISAHAKSGVRRHNTQAVVVPFPWIVFAVELSSTNAPYSARMYYRNAPLSKDDMEVYTPMMMNVYYGSQEVCLPGGFRDSYESVGAGITAFLDKFWNSSFNHDICIDWGILSYFYSENKLDVPATTEPTTTMDYFKLISNFSLEHMTSFKYFPCSFPSHMFANGININSVKVRLQQPLYV